MVRNVWNIGNVKFTFSPVDPNALTDDDEDTFIGSVGDLIDLNAALVVASSNRDVRPCFLRPVKVHTIEMIRWIHLNMASQPTQHYLEVNFP